MCLIVENYNEIKKENINNSLYMSYQTSALTSYFVGLSLNGKKIPTFEDMFPDCMSEEDRKKIEKAKMAAYVEQWKAFMVIHNKNRGGS